MQNIRIIELPVIKAAYSGLVQGGSKEFLEFNQWFSKFHANLKYELFPRDFLRYNERLNGFEWYYALPCDLSKKDCGGYDIVDLPAGLCAVSSCLDGDMDQAKDWLDTRSMLIEWVNQNDHFDLYQNAQDKPERYPMFTITSPHRFYQQKISIEDFYLPIVER
ncbi:MAG: GyrI-like domain-containing protein [Oscillospiraceae bacterium]|nr:GyrI-like domain-containing protein [Oscillospiraceae bacterium]